MQRYYQVQFILIQLSFSLTELTEAPNYPRKYQEQDAITNLQDSEIRSLFNCTPEPLKTNKQNKNSPRKSCFFYTPSLIFYHFASTPSQENVTQIGQLLGNLGYALVQQD